MVLDIAFSDFLHKIPKMMIDNDKVIAITNHLQPYRYRVSQLIIFIKIKTKTEPINNKPQSLNL